MKPEKKNQIDLNDLAYVEERYGLAISSKPCPQSKLTGKINPHVSSFKLLGQSTEKTVSVFHVKPIYYEHASSTDEEMVWRPMYEVCSHYGNHLVVFEYEKLLEVHPRFMEWLKKRMRIINGQILITSPFGSVPTPYNFVHEMVHTSIVRPKIGLTTTTVYPDPHPETTTVDGYVARDGVVETWATAHDGSTGTGASDSATQSNMCYVTDGQPTNNKWIYRGVFLFDTSAITDTDVIDSGTFSAYVTSIYDEAMNDSTKEYITMCSANPASNTALATTDYDYNDFGTTHLSDDVSTFQNTSYNAYIDWTLNTAGKSAVSKTGVTKLGMRQGYDITNTEAIASSGYPNNGINGGRWADYTGTTSDPKLVLVHTAGVTEYPQAITATVTGTGSMTMTKNILSALTASAVATASMLKGMTQELTANVTNTASILAGIAYAQLMEATTSVSASVEKAIIWVQALTASAVGTASMTKIPGKLLEAVATITATVTAGREVLMIAAVTVTATTTTAIGIVLTALVNIVAKVTAPFHRIKYPPHGDETDYDVKYTEHGDADDYSIKYPHE